MLRYSCHHFEELTTSALYDIMALRQQVFVVEQNCPYLDADGVDLQCWHLLGQASDDALLAYARLIPRGLVFEEYTSIGRVITAPQIRGRGAGRQLTQKALDWLDHQFPAAPVKISAQCYLIRFYESFGFETVGESYLEDDIPHIGMIRSQKRVGKNQP